MAGVSYIEFIAKISFYNHIFPCALPQKSLYCNVTEKDSMMPMDVKCNHYFNNHRVELFSTTKNTYNAYIQVEYNILILSQLACLFFYLNSFWKLPYSQKAD